MGRLGVEELLRQKVDLGNAPGRANVGLKGVALIAMPLEQVLEAIQAVTRGEAIKVTIEPGAPRTRADG